MGTHVNITSTKFPKQGRFLGKTVEICFHYETDQLFQGTCIRDDMEEPFLTIFQLADGRVVLGKECQYR